MQETSLDPPHLIVAVVPFAVLSLVALRHGWHIRKALTTKDGPSLAQVVDEFMREIKRANDAAEAQGTTPPSPRQGQ